MSLDKDVVDYLSREWGVDPAFIEKDWHAVRVLNALTNYSHDDFTCIFSGGTSLSKGHGLIKRFSEDLDFRVRFDIDNKPSRSEIRCFRGSVIDALRNVEDISFKDDAVQKNGLGFKIQLTYPKEFATPLGIRPDLQVEFSYTQPKLEAEYKPIGSMIARYKGEHDETSFLCLPPVEIAADKLSSLTWRVHKRDREDTNDDPAMIRHLHDLSALSEIISENQESFAQLALQSFSTDQVRENRKVGMNIVEAAIQAHNIMKDDLLYAEEYGQFVDAMSYAYDDEKIAFDDALKQFEKLTLLLQR